MSEYEWPDSVPQQFNCGYFKEEKPCEHPHCLMPRAREEFFKRLLLAEWNELPSWIQEKFEKWGDGYNSPESWSGDGLMGGESGYISSLKSEFVAFLMEEKA